MVMVGELVKLYKAVMDDTDVWVNYKLYGEEYDDLEVEAFDVDYDYDLYIYM